MAIKYIPFYLAAFLGGVMFRSFFDISVTIVLAAFAALFSFYLFLYLVNVRVFKKNHQNQILFFALLLFLLGLIRLSLFEENTGKDQLHNFYSQTISINGTVLTTELKPNSQRVVVNTNLGDALVVTNVYPRYQYGDVVSITGAIKEPEAYGDYDTKKILSKDNIYSEIIFPDIKYKGQNPPNKLLYYLFKIRSAFETNIQLILPEPHASLANGMLLGDGSGLDKEITEAFRKSGTIHILVLSGYNITIVGVFVMAVLSFIFPQSIAWFGSVLGILIFTAMTGGQAPAVRSAIMAIIGLLALRSGRKSMAGLALLWAAFFMVMWNPMTLNWDRGFQLSFLATLGLIVASPIFKKKLSFLPSALGIQESGASTLAAQLFVLPLLLSWGSEVSFLSPLANILIVGIVPLVMFFSFVGGILAFSNVFAGKLISSVAYILISFQIYVAKTISTIPMSSVVFSGLPTALIFGVYALLFYWSARYYISGQYNV